MNFTVKGIHHLGVAPKNIQLAKDFFSKHLNLPLLEEEVVAHQQVQTSIFASKRKNNTSDALENCTHIELLEGLSENSPISKFLIKKGSGVHHIALEVDDIDAAHSQLKSEGIEFIGENVGKGASGTRVIFIHPRSTGGILLELVEPPH